MLKRILAGFGLYVRDASGVVAIVLAMAIPMVMASAGLAVDLAAAYNAKNRLSSALDKAALAAASSSGTDQFIRERMRAFFDANYPAEKYGEPFDVDMIVNGSVMTVSASVRVPTRFMTLFGQDYVIVHEETQVVRELAGVEAVLVLDITGSMAGNNITALKAASNNFVNVMFDKIVDPQYLKIGIVPWSNAVNVGPYGKGFTPAGATYGTPFVDNPSTDPYVTPASSIVYGPGQNDWGGCVIERSPSSALTDASTPNWPMYRYPANTCAEYNCTQYNCAQYNCVRYNCAQYNCLRYNSSGRCTRYGTTCLSYSTTCAQYGTTCLVPGTTCIAHGATCVQWSGDPNNSCPDAPILPLTNDKAQIQGVINNLPTRGNTYSNLGMIWGWRVISPDFPFTEGAPYEDNKWSKTVILMTDGDNTINRTYSGEGPYNTPGTSLTATDQNNKFAQICTNMKAKGIRIYTITFQSAINNTTKSFYRNCATNPGMYFDAPSNQSLTEAFQSIANQLSQLHITK